jgi:trigger factor
MTMTDSHKPEDSTSAADDAALEKAAADQSQDPSAEGAAEEEKKEELQLEVSIEKRGACERHITVVVPRTDIDRYFEREFSELVNSAQVPGFRPGRAPRKLIEHRFKKDVGERVKGNLLMDGIAQVSQREELSPISEPDLKLDAVELPDEGPMTF